MSAKTLDISWASLWRVLLMMAFGAVLYLLIDVLVILFLAIVISSAFDAPISFLERKKIPRILGTILIFISILAVLGLLLYTIVPVAIFEFNSLYNSFIKNHLDLPFFESLKNIPFEQLERSISGFTDAFLAGRATFTSLISLVFGSLVSVVAVFVLSFYLAVSKYGVEKFLKAAMPARYEDYVLDVYFRARRKIGLWMQGQLLLSLIIGLLVFIGLFFMGVKYSLIFGILAGVLEMVPFVGPVFVGALAVLTGFSESLTLGVSVLVLFIIIQQLENHLLVPLVTRYTTGLHPVIVVISLLAGANLAGLVGILLAVPTAVVITEVLEDWATRKKNKNNA